MKKVTPLLILIATLATLSACTLTPKTSSDTSIQNGTPIFVETETINSPEPTSTPMPPTPPKTSTSPQSDQDLLRELDGQSDISVDSDLNQIETQFR